MIAISMLKMVIWVTKVANIKNTTERKFSTLIQNSVVDSKSEELRIRWTFSKSPRMR